MEKEIFIEKLAEIFEIDQTSYEITTAVQLDSLSVLSVIALADKELSKTIAASEFEALGNTNPCLGDILDICGLE